MPKYIPESVKAQIRADYEDERLERGVERGRCFCDCGEVTRISEKSHAPAKLLEGEPLRYARSHGGRSKQIHNQAAITTVAEYREWYMETKPPNVKWGDCFCGCGQPAAIAERTKVPQIKFEGEPLRFVRGHNVYSASAKRKKPLHYIEEDRGYDTPCWIWQLFTDKNGYGSIRNNGPQRRAHRVYYEAVYGPIPDGYHLHHLCGVTSCVNYDHVKPMIPKDHSRTDRAKLSVEKARLIRELLASGQYTGRELARRFEVSEQLICDVKSGRRWRD